MTDFHRSLDRALDPDPHNDWGIEPEALMEVGPREPLGEGWQTVGYIDEVHNWPTAEVIPSLRDMIDRITNRMIVDLKEDEARAAGFAIDWKDPEPLVLKDLAPYLEAVRSDIRLMVSQCLDEPVAYDGFGAPLYAHQISPEGTE